MFEAHEFARHVAEACGAIGLQAVVLAPTRVRVSDGSSRQVEVIKLEADASDAARLYWCWSWGQRIAPADGADRVAELVSRVVVPAGNPANVPYSER